MDSHGHQRSDLRNLHLHRAALAKLRQQPELRGPCLALLARWLSAPEQRPSWPYLERWRELLAGRSDDELDTIVLDPEAGQALRQCSPLGPVLEPRERWALLAEANRSLEEDAAPNGAGVEEREQPAPLCYCFGFTRADVVREVAETGSCSVQARIEAEMKAHGCSCKTKNPSGGCCLAEVRRVVEEAQRG